MIDFENLEKQIAERGRIETLENGATIISENVPRSGVVNGGIRIVAGSLHEKPQDHGVMHFLEHTCFSESKLYSTNFERAKDAASIGLQLDAITNYSTVTFPVKGDNNWGLCFQRISCRDST